MLVSFIGAGVASAVTTTFSSVVVSSVTAGVVIPSLNKGVISVPSLPTMAIIPLTATASPSLTLK